MLEELRRLVPDDGAEWVPVSRGQSGAVVFHDVPGRRFVKIVPVDVASELAGERDRIAWLGRMGIPGPAVLDWNSSARGASLVMTAVPGVPADRLGADALRRAWPSITDRVRELHDLPVTDCPFDRRLEIMMAAARSTVNDDRVQSAFLPEELQRTPPRSILRGLEQEVPRRLLQEHSELVVCHGDLSLPNILIDPESLRMTGFIDLGRLGCADPYADLALLLATARGTWRNERDARAADNELGQRYGRALETDRLRFYLWLDPLTW